MVGACAASQQMSTPSSHVHLAAEGSLELAGCMLYRSGQGTVLLVVTSRKWAACSAAVRKSPHIMLGFRHLHDKAATNHGLCLRMETTPRMAYRDQRAYSPQHHAVL